jgi:hypothetical protein
MCALFSTSIIVRDAVYSISKQIECAIEQPINLVEYITLPDFGQRIILRYKSVYNRQLSYNEVDMLESRMRTFAGANYWVTLTVDSSEDVDYNLFHQLVAINRKIPANILDFNPTPHAEEIQQDAYLLRDSLNLTEDLLIWEIEVPIPKTLAPIIIRIIDTSEEGEGPSSRHISEQLKVGDERCQAVFLKNNTSFVGCLKAYFAAEQQQMALVNFISQFKDV